MAEVSAVPLGVPHEGIAALDRLQGGAADRTTTPGSSGGLIAGRARGRSPLAPHPERQHKLVRNGRIPGRTQTLVLRDGTRNGDDDEGFHGREVRRPRRHA